MRLLPEQWQLFRRSADHNFRQASVACRIVGADDNQVLAGRKADDAHKEPFAQGIRNAIGSFDGLPRAGVHGVFATA